MRLPQLSFSIAMVAPGTSVTLQRSSPVGTIWYTTDGSDPRSGSGLPVGLEFVGGGHHHQIRPLGGLCDGHHLEAIGLDLLGGGGAGLEGDGDVLGA